MIVGLVLEKQKPVLRFAVNVYIDLNGASVDLLRLVKFVEFALRFQIFYGKRCNIHETNGLCSAEFFADLKIIVICALQQFVLEDRVVYARQKCCMTAMIRPICVDHSDLRHRRIPMFGYKVFLTKGYIVRVHCKTVFFYKRFKSRAVKRHKAVKRRNRFRNIVSDGQCCGLRKRRLARFNGVYNMFFYCFKFFFRNISVKHINLRGADNGTVAL